ncbi:MAG TPA: hypothetical protein DCX89_03705 [Saprospirales bacterium]|nr:hypothetical protein [Saprospirales bacterium]
MIEKLVELIWSWDNLEIWKWDNLEIWKWDNLEIWKWDNLEMRSLVIWNWKGCYKVDIIQIK